MMSYEEVNNTSYSLYTLSKWDELLSYGKKAIQHHQDFLYLRLRLGYAAIMKGNYSEAAMHYNKVIRQDEFNEIANYYLWVSYNALNQSEFASRFYPKISNELKAKNQLKKTALTLAGIESSIKTTDVTTRNNAFYNKLSFNTRLGWNLNLQQSVVSYNQQIAEPKLKNVDNNTAININQVEYYAMIALSIKNNIEIKGAYHFIKTPFNNYTYHDNVNMLAVKYHGNYINLQASIITGTLIDSAIHQYNLQLDYFPQGNSDLYGISTLTSSSVNASNRINFKQVLGIILANNLWFEGNATLGKFSNYLENDALYVYNSIDPNTLKCGANAYFFSGKHMKLQFGYTLEKRSLTLYNPEIIFHQHSINGGITWKF